VNGNNSGEGPQVPMPPAMFPLMGIGAGYLLQTYIPSPEPLGSRFSVLGFLVFNIAVLLVLWAVFTLRKFDTTTIPHKMTKHLVTTGPYRLSRNPIYLSFLLLVLASGLTSGNIWMLASLPIVMWSLTKYAIEPEEAHLHEQFDEDYTAYISKVRKWL
jgi:protein-S-isoprenylcysteine O-methyltransferase Ste14